MKNTYAVVPCLVIAVALLAGCGDKASSGASQPSQNAAAANSPKLSNATVKDAGDTLMKALIEGDRKVIDSINHSGPTSFPTTYLMSEFGSKIQAAGTTGIKVLGVEGNSYSFSIRDEKYKSDDVFKFQFLKEKDGYFFDRMSK